MEWSDAYLHMREDAEARYMRALPTCEGCGEKIEDEFLFDIDGRLYCEDCANDLFRRCTENYMDYEKEDNPWLI